MECINPRHALLRGRRVGASNDPATLRCGITALQRRKNYGILWSASTTLMHAMTPPHFAAGSLHSKERLRLRLSIHYRAEHYSEGKIVELNTAYFRTRHSFIFREKRVAFEIKTKYIFNRREIIMR